MKSRRPLRTCVQRGLRLTLPVAPASPRPLLLTWLRTVRRAGPGRARIGARTVHQHHHVALHLHFASAAPGTRFAARAGPLSTIRSLIDRTVATIHNGRHDIALRHTHIHAAGLSRQTTQPATQRGQRVQLMTTSHAHSTHTHSHPHSHSHSHRSALVPAGSIFTKAPRRDAASSTAWRRASSDLTPTLPAVRGPAPEQVAPATRRAPSPALSLVWCAASIDQPAPAAEIQEDMRVSATASLPTTASARAATPVTVPVTASQARDAVRANLLDPAIADRLADDVIRRVEKRMRIERERRGL